MVVDVVVVMVVLVVVVLFVVVVLDGLVDVVVGSVGTAEDVVLEVIVVGVV